MKTAIEILAIWFALSIPIGIIVGHIISMDD